MKRLLCAILTRHAQTGPASVRWRFKVSTDDGPWFVTGGWQCRCGKRRTFSGEPVPERPPAEAGAAIRLLQENDELPAGLVAELGALQEGINSELREMSPKERAEAAMRDLERMPGQAYLFPDARPDADGTADGS